MRLCRHSTDINAGGARVTYQLCLQVIATLQFVIFALSFNFHFRRDDAQHRQGFHILTLTAACLGLGLDIFQALTNFQSLKLV